MDPLWVAVPLAVFFTAVICLIDTSLGSKAQLRATFTWQLLPYVVIFVVGNTFATLLASPMVDSQVPASLSNWFGFFSAFAGVFGFHGVISNANISFFGRGVLTIDDWIEAARERAVAAAIDRKVTLDTEAELKTANALAELPEADLNVYVVQYLGNGVVESLDRAAQDAGAGQRLYKALSLASAKPAKRHSEKP